MITLKVNIENEIYANMFAELIANFTFVQSVEIPQFARTYNFQTEKTNENFVIPPKKNGNPAVYCGIWANKEINDIKEFRNNLWLRKK